MRIKKLLAVVLGTVLAISSFSYTSWAAGDDNKVHQWRNSNLFQGM